MSLRSYFQILAALILLTSCSYDNQTVDPGLYGLMTGHSSRSSKQLSAGHSDHHHSSASCGTTAEPGLIVHYTLDGHALDSGGKGYHGTVHGAVLTNDRFGKPGKAYYFDNPYQMRDGDFGQHIDCGNPPELNRLKSITIAAWASRDSDATHGRIAGKNRNDAGGGFALDFWANDSGCIGTTLNVYVTGTESVVRNAFHYIVGTYDYDSGHMKIYVDGILKNSRQVGQIETLNATDEHLTIGAYAGWGYAGLSGIVDDVKIYNYARTDGQIYSDFLAESQPEPADGLVAWYPFDGNARDASIYGYHGTVHGAVLTNDRFGRPGMAYYFENPRQMQDGVFGQHIDCGNNPVLNQLKSLSVTAWVKKNPGAYYGRIAGKERNDFTRGWAIDCWGQNQGCFASAPGFYAIGAGGPHFADGFHLITGTYDCTSGVMNLYIDGALVRTVQQGRIETLTDETENLIVGAFAGYGYAGMNGIIDDFRIYNRALSRSEILALYSADSECPEEQHQAE